MYEFSIAEHTLQCLPYFRVALSAEKLENRLQAIRWFTRDIESLSLPSFSQGAAEPFFNSETGRELRDWIART